MIQKCLLCRAAATSRVILQPNCPPRETRFIVKQAQPFTKDQYTKGRVGFNAKPPSCPPLTTQCRIRTHASATSAPTQSKTLIFGQPCCLHSALGSLAPAVRSATNYVCQSAPIENHQGCRWRSHRLSVARPTEGQAEQRIVCHSDPVPAMGKWGLFLSKPLRTLPSRFLDAAVLVVEDEVLIGMMLASLLQDMGFSSITIAANGEQALRAADAKDFGLIVSDIILEHSKLNGIDIVVSLMQRKPVPVVFITAHAGVAELQRIAAETPRAAVLRKPVAYRELHNSIAALVSTWCID